MKIRRLDDPMNRKFKLQERKHIRKNVIGHGRGYNSVHI